MSATKGRLHVLESNGSIVLFEGLLECEAVGNGLLVVREYERAPGAIYEREARVHFYAPGRWVWTRFVKEEEEP